jgi:phosphate transport system permease protein
MPPLALTLLIVGIGLIGWASARVKAARFVTTSVATRPHSLPGYHAAYVFLWTVVPALIFAVIWSVLSPQLVLADVLTDPAAKALPAWGMERSAILAEARAVASGLLPAPFNDAAAGLVAPYGAALSRYNLIGITLSLILVFAGGAFAFSRVSPAFRARTQIERLIMFTLLIASLIAILTTIGIVASLVFETGRFFSAISPLDFLLGTHWSPGNAIGANAGDSFGAVPLFWGTIFIGAIIAMIVAIPLGLMCAIYLTQYAEPALRKWLKPLLEILAGVPTVVYGYFAALTVAPAVRDFAAFIGMSNPSSESALAAGLVMGVMIIPLISSMADDSIAAVPQSMRDGSLAMGATTSETIRNVIVPAALPGVVGGVLLAVSRAIGETMIVVMAAGLAANLTANPFGSVTTVTTQIVQLLTGDQEFDSPKTLAAFALGLVLFVVTFLLNIVALQIVKKYREAYD